MIANGRTNSNDQIDYMEFIKDVCNTMDLTDADEEIYPHLLEISDIYDADIALVILFLDERNYFYNIPMKSHCLFHYNNVSNSISANEV